MSTTSSGAEGLVIGIGEILWDCLPQGKQLGGAPANFAYHVSQWGLPGCAVSAVGRDADGSQMLALLDRKGVRSLMALTDYPTGTVNITVDDAGIPQYDITPDAAWDHIPFTPELAAAAASARAVCFGSLAQRSPESRATIRRFLESMPAEALRVFDINLRQHFYTPDVLRKSMEMSNILKINDEELVTVSGMFSVEASAPAGQCRELLRRMGLSMVILTCGVEGSYIFTADGGESYRPTPRVKVADTVGAGDSFTAAFIANLLKGLPFTDAHALAVSASAYVCTCDGAMPELPAHLLA